MSTSLNISTRVCVNCKIRRTDMEFESETKKVCIFCATDEGYARIMQRRINEAGAAFRRILDTRHVPVMREAPKISDMLVLFFEKWGGQEQFIADLVKHGKDLIEKKPVHLDTTRFLTGMLKLVNEDNKRQDALDVAQMTDEQLKREQQMAMLELLMESAVDQEKNKLLMKLLEAFNLPKTEAMAAEVRNA